MRCSPGLLNPRDVVEAVRCGFSAAFAGLARAISVFFVSIVDPLIFDAYYTQIILVIVIVRGLGSFWPVVVAGSS